MVQKRHTVDEIVANLRKGHRERGNGKKVSEICQLLEATEHTFTTSGSSMMA